jgi:hypothetical protein
MAERPRSRRRFLRRLAVVLLLMAMILVFMPLLVTYLPPPPRPVVSMQARGAQERAITTGPFMSWIVDFGGLLDTCAVEGCEGRCCSRFVLSVQDASGALTVFRCETGAEKPGLDEQFASVPAGFGSIEVGVDVVESSTECASVPIRVKARGPTLVTYWFVWTFSLPFVVLLLLGALWACRAARKESGTLPKSATG